MRFGISVIARSEIPLVSMCEVTSACLRTPPSPILTATFTGPLWPSAVPLKVYSEKDVPKVNAAENMTAVMNNIVFFITLTSCEVF